VEEVELKGVVPDEADARWRLEAAGARLAYEGRLEDLRYDTRDRALAGRDHVLRVRVYRTAEGARASIDWKGPTRHEDGYKRREELSSGATDGDALGAILERLGYVVTREIEREIAQYELHGAVVRFERYPRMDLLVEVEGTPDSIERAIATLGIAREAFTSERLPAFVARYEQRTGQRAALCARELHDDYRFDAADA
jgi:predicted adenylyl cyclase CyaB